MHASTNAVLVQDGMVNVKHRQCAEQGCSTRPAFNWKGEEKGLYCNKHKEKGMINVDRKDVIKPGVFSFLSHLSALEPDPFLG
jgi:hypothetical protein